ncbi:MAG: A24 family peptidase [Burkholderiales bacterium]|nr:A24 family peptidase [Burkholderiales bacterium]
MAATIVGLCVGSFLNVVIHRLPRMMQRDWELQCAELRNESPPEGAAARYNLIVPRSTCPVCQHRITALENIPIVSWLFLRGKCSQCSARISIRYPLVELLGGLLAGLAFWFFGPSWQALTACVLLWTLLALTFIDADTQLLPDHLTLPLLWGGLLVNLFGVFTTLSQAVIGAMAGYLSLWLVYWAFKLLRNKEGMGYGDFKLLAALGAWLGWPMLIPIVLLSSLMGALVGGGLILFRGHDHQVPMPFGPFLAMAGAVVLFFGPTMTRWLYLPY